MQAQRYEFSREAADVAELLAVSGLRNGVEPEPAIEPGAALVAEAVTTAPPRERSRGQEP